MPRADDIARQRAARLSGAAKLKPARLRNRTPKAFWCLVMVKRGMEHTARKQASNQGYTAFNPRWQPTMRGKLQPYFPGYIFVRIDGKDWTPLRNTVGVWQIAASGDGTPWRVPHRIITDLLRAQDREGILRTAEQMAIIEEQRLDARALKPGEAVEFKAGAFKPLPAVYKGMAAGNRIHVILNLMGKDVPMEIDRGEVRPRHGR